MKVNSTYSPLDTARQIERSKTPGAIGQKEPAAGRGASHANDGSTVEISENAILMKQAADLAKQAPDIDQSRVNSLKERIRSGNYKVDASVLAEKILEQHLANDFGKNNL
ncbi:MAG: flagellar biosynthesis anti-sigma factor FlgM [Deltaproteobacteria bacterium]|nr:flagellar biosynthesis anti-sigma factor FlgM [Deltaproteobacteria bacterium]